MIPFITELTTVIEKGLDAALSTASTRMELAEKNIVLFKAVVGRLKVMATDYVFRDAAEEIEFFKHSTPPIFCQLIYNLQLYRFESRRAISGSALEKKQILQALRKIEIFLLDNESLCSYYHSRSSVLDEIYFMRGKPALHLLEEDESVLIDSSYCTVAGYTLAKIMAYEMLQRYLQDYLDAPQGATTGKAETLYKKPFAWSDSKAALIELVYALYASGAVNHGKANLNEIAQMFEKMFSVELGNYYRTFQNMRIRKKSRTGYLDLLRENLEKLMDETDDVSYKL